MDSYRFFTVIRIFILVLISSSLKGQYFYKIAPGLIQFKIVSIEIVGGCYKLEDGCSYLLDVCLGSGYSSQERCLWLSHTQFKGQIELKLTPNPVFNVSVDNIRSNLYFTANVTVTKATGEISQLSYKSLIQFKSQKSTIENIYSLERFSEMKLEIDVMCERGFYPAYNCTIKCFNSPNVYDCDVNGNKKCLTGYKYSERYDDCFKDRCADQLTFCKNGAECLNDLISISCACTDNYSGMTCDKWDPCKLHKCQNNAGCHPESEPRSSVSHPNATSYICICRGHDWGKYCQHRTPTKPAPKVSPPRRRPPSSIHMKEDPFLVSDGIGSDLPTKEAPPKKTPMMNDAIKPVIREDIQDDSRMTNVGDSVRLIQAHPFNNAYTIMAVSFVLLVFLVGIFAISYWILKIKYFRNNKKYLISNADMMHNGGLGGAGVAVGGNYTLRSHLGQAPHDLGEMSPSFRRCYSLDDSSFQIHPSAVNSMVHSQYDPMNGGQPSPASYPANDDQFCYMTETPYGGVATSASRRYIAQRHGLQSPSNDMPQLTTITSHDDMLHDPMTSPHHDDNGQLCNQV